MSNLASWQRSLVDGAGNLLTEGEVRVFPEPLVEGVLATIYSDREGTSEITQPVDISTLSPRGFFRFFASAGEYAIRVTRSGASSTWRYETLLDTVGDVVWEGAHTFNGGLDVANAVTQTSFTGSAKIPAGDASERDVTPVAGYLRFNTDTGTHEAWNGSSWVPVGGGTASTKDHGTAADQVPLNNDLSTVAATGAYDDLSGKPTLGTAAAADVTTSETDTTAGRVLKVGDFGLGDYLTDELSNDAEGLAVRNGFYRTSSSTIGSRPLNSTGQFLTVSRSGTRWTQFYMPFSTAGPSMFFRHNDANTPSPWRELYHSGNYPSDTAWTSTTSLDNDWTGTIRYIKRAGMVTIVLDAVNGSASGGEITMLSLASAYRPTGAIIRSTAIDGNNSASIALFNVTGAGNVQVEGTGTTYRGSVTYPVIT